MKKFAALVAVLALICFAAPAFAANPFMDVPMNHWAYDAVSQLASRGVVSGYPDGAFKGEWKATRYEMASVVARALAYVDMNKASKQDLELLKKLVVEFKDELDALGVKVDELDSRVAVLEEGVGGWKISGYFRTQWNWSDDNAVDPGWGNLWGVDQDTDWQTARWRLNLAKYVDEKVSFYGRLQSNTAGASPVVELAYMTIKFPWDITATVGRFWLDWEGDFYVTDFAGWSMNDAWITDIRLNSAMAFQKPFGMGEFQFVVGHEEDYGLYTAADDFLGIGPGTDFSSDTYVWGARLAFNFNEQFRMSANYFKWDFFMANADVATLWGDLVFDFTPGIAFKGQYFMQDLDAGIAVTGEDSPKAWKAILDVDQDVLGGFTSLWIEYAQIDNNFLFMWADPYAWGAGYSGVTVSKYLAGTGMGVTVGDTNVLNIVAKQQWNEQWWTYVRYINADGDFDPFDYSGWTVSVRYNYTPNMFFELGYDKIDNDAMDANGFDDNVIFFRTFVSF